MFFAIRPNRAAELRAIETRGLASDRPTFTDDSLGSPPWFQVIHSHSATSTDRGSAARISLLIGDGEYYHTKVRVIDR